MTTSLPQIQGSELLPMTPIQEDCFERIGQMIVYVDDIQRRKTNSTHPPVSGYGLFNKFKKWPLALRQFSYSSNDQDIKEITEILGEINAKYKLALWGDLLHQESVEPI